MDEQAAIKNIRDGGQKGFLFVYKKYVMTLHGYIKSKYRIPEDSVEDVLQKIFLKFFNTIDSFKQDCSVSTWLHQIANSVAIDYWHAEKTKYEHVRIDTPDDETNENIQPYQIIDTLLYEISNEQFQKVQDDLDIQMCIERVLTQLALDDSKASFLKCLNALTFQAHGSSIPDIAKERDSTPDATRRYLSDCRKKLKQYQPLQRCWELLKKN